MKIKSDLFANILGMFARRKAVYDKRIMHPEREWFIGLFLFAAIVTAGGIQSAHTFMAFQEIDTNGGTQTEPVVRYNQPLVQNALQTYEKRSEVYMALQNEVPQLPASTLDETATTSTSTSPSETEEPADGDEVIMAI